MNVIGISGKAGSGKDYIGKHVMEPLGFKKWALAWPMKNEALGAHRNWMWQDVHVNKPADIRAWLQRRGTEEGWMKYDRDYWLRIAHGWMQTMFVEWGVTDFYIPDVRFPHEVTYIQERMGGHVVRILSDRTNRLTPEQNAHTSETALDDYTGFDAWVLNDKTGNNDVGNLRHAFSQFPFMQEAFDKKNPQPVAPVIGEPYWHTLARSDANAGLSGTFGDGDEDVARRIALFRPLMNQFLDEVAAGLK